MSCWGFTDFLITALAVLLFLCFTEKKKTKQQTQALRMDLLNKEKSECLRTLRTPDCICKVSVITTCFCPDVQRCRSTSLAIMDSFHPLKCTHLLASCQFMSVSSCWHVIRSARLFVFVQRLTLTHCPAWLKGETVEDVGRGCTDWAENENHEEREEEEVLYLCFSWPLLCNRGHQVLQAILRSSALFRWQGSAFSKASFFSSCGSYIVLQPEPQLWSYPQDARRAPSDLQKH